MKTSAHPNANDTSDHPEYHCGARQFIAVPVLAALFFGVSDLVFGFTRVGPSLQGALEHGVLLASIMGHVACAGLVLAAAWWLLARVGCAASQRAGSRGKPASFWMVAALLAVGFIWVNLTTFDGPAIKAHRWHAVIVWVFRIVGILGIVGSLLILRSIFRRAVHSRAARCALILGGGAAAIGCEAANIKILAGQYPMMHTQLVALSLAGWIVAAAAILMHCRSYNKIAAIVAALLVALGVACGFSDAWARTSTAAATRGPATAEIAAWTDKLFALTRPQRRQGVIDPDMAAVFATKSAAEIQAGLDTLLPERRSMNILWIALDTVRADRVSFNGYARKTTPRIDQLAKDAFVFKQAYSTYPTSNYSYASLLTGRTPRGTPLYARLNKTSATVNEHLFFPELLAQNGWFTAGVTAFDKATAINPDWFGMLSKGFQSYNPDQTEAAPTATHITQSTLGVLHSRPKKPFFIWAHYMDPHAPYQVWPDSNFGSSISDAYDSEIAMCDREVGKILDDLEKRGETERTMIVVFSDHGEEFEEHNGLYHNSSVYEQQIHVPLLIRIPGMKGRSVNCPVSLSDVVPTTLSLLGIKDAEVRHGRDLVPLLLDPSADSAGLAYAEFFGIKAGHRERDLRTVISGQHKIIWHVQRDLYELYNLAADPLERENLIGRGSAEEPKMRGLLAGWDARIDAQGGSAPVIAGPQAGFLNELHADVDGLIALEKAAADAKLAQILKAIFDYTRELTPPAAVQLGEDGVDKFAAELVTRWEATKDPAAKNRLARLIYDLARGSTIPFLEARFRDGKEASFRAAAALARHGNATGQSVLQQLLAAESPLDRRQVAVALAHLKDPAAFAWAEAILTSSQWQQVAALSEALPRMGLPNLGYFIRDYVTQGLLRPVPIQAKLAIHLAPAAADPEVRWLLLRFAHDGEPIIREAARSALKVAGITQAELDAARAAAQLELDGDLAITNRVYPHALTRYREAVAKSTGLNAGLRLRFARHLHAQGQVDEARTVLGPVAATAEDPLDRGLASRRLEMLQAPARFKDRAAFAAEITQLKAPEGFHPGLPFLCTFMLKNTGTTPWQGGYWQFPNVLRAEWQGKDGKRLDTREPSACYLPATGVMPGETVPMLMMVFAPAAPVQQATLVMTFTQMESALPPATEIYRHATAWNVGAAPKVVK